MKQLIAAFSLMFLVISATVLASQLNVKFAQLDTDSDGQISLLEAKQNNTLLKQFTDLDDNNDEQLSEQEFAKFKF
ncbi:hypothetical protein H5154_01445 [Pseudoalteromonas sp. SR44-5]|jgi:hypothetical protein|uniref:EF-hand domain-containing protein n=2 Tax=Pseudoalteromonas TaxID=53246 RepID=A0ABY3FGY8_9GAMM|nr:MULTISPECIES: hypothetical protein [Pseudoalteromonas]MBB1293239.1 hypothetical protein [Pseudoalteromonas sp. SR41-4]MBB1308677.1 hypothetical protein [Pseudoalteromonas sp. SR41-8]MBB1331673.1 hypothetical protein [Pseudoalteromonas sp. SR41-6]MBB1341657.1 hypothetical protein [Pseudoalteromonas sp. SR45-6]MBB1365063.1 hypothetical protein [Pseudoalteromonas sp. SR44-5]|tara:strand:+ start:214 stop:441 length:228 start_codon:yes stop_codon:yes gene_type:complete